MTDDEGGLSAASLLCLSAGGGGDESSLGRCLDRCLLAGRLGGEAATAVL